MQAATMESPPKSMQHTTQRYATCIAASKRIRWDIDRDVIRDNQTPRTDMNRHSLRAACCAAMLLAACAGAARIEVPAGLAPGANEALSMVVAARGVQIYECRARTGAAMDPEWVFVAPEAELFDAHGRSIGQHGAGPHWQANDSSRIQGTVKARADAPVAGAIPWLLLSAKSVGPEGSFSKVSSIQRVSTAGGSAPAGGCDRKTMGTTIRIPYTADYHFFSAR